MWWSSFFHHFIMMIGMQSTFMIIITIVVFSPVSSLSLSCGALQCQWHRRSFDRYWNKVGCLSSWLTAYTWWSSPSGDYFCVCAEYISLDSRPSQTNTKKRKQNFFWSPVCFNSESLQNLIMIFSNPDPKSWIILQWVAWDLKFYDMKCKAREEWALWRYEKGTNRS